MSKTIKYDTLNTTSRDFAMPVEETVSHDDNHPFTPNVEDPRFCADCGLLLVDHGDAPKSSELTLDEAIKWAQEWQESSELAIPAEIVTGLVDGAIALRDRVSLLERAFTAYASDTMAKRAPQPIDPPILGFCVTCGFPIYASERDGEHFHYSPQGYYCAPIVCGYAKLPGANS